MRRLEIDPVAAGELNDAVFYYERRQTGLGTEFTDRFAEGIQAIQALPAGYPIIHPPYRCHNMNQFPYGIVYEADPDLIYIMALKNHYRHPDYWKDRLR